MAWLKPQAKVNSNFRFAKRDFSVSKLLVFSAVLHAFNHSHNANLTLPRLGGPTHFGFVPAVCLTGVTSCVTSSSPLCSSFNVSQISVFSLHLSSEDQSRVQLWASGLSKPDAPCMGLSNQHGWPGLVPPQVTPIRPAPLPVFPSSACIQVSGPETSELP